MLVKIAALVVAALIIFGVYTKINNNRLQALYLKEQTVDMEGSNILEPKDVAGTSTSEGYSYISVASEKGNFNVQLVKLPLSKYKVKTVAANKDNCKKDCPTKTLAQYISENNAVAGINGSYFCPPDYASCKDKKNSFDYAFYNSNKGKWLNKHALSWNKTAVAIFKGNSAKFYKDSSTASTSDASAGISNYPALLKDSNVVVNNLTDPQKVRGTRGAIGVDDKYIYLAIIRNATVTEAAYAMKALGVKHALNLDGGGSAALYYQGAYKIGPGRTLPNAIVLVK